MRSGLHAPIRPREGPDHARPSLKSRPEIPISRSGMLLSRLFLRFARRLRSEAGFSLVEAMIAAFILAIGAFAVIQALDFGLTQSGLARQRQTADQLANQEDETARGVNYANLGLGRHGPPTKP